MFNLDANTEAICLLRLFFVSFDLANGFISFHCNHFHYHFTLAIVSENKPRSVTVVFVRMAFIGTLNCPTYFILTAFTSSIIFFVGQLLFIIILVVLVT